jgi:wobble nucleotide-excising tRNase
MSVLDRLQLIRNVGKFDSVNAGAQLPFSKLTLIYAENGRGKTTLAAILRSLSDGNPELILERKRLTTTNRPHVVLNANGVQYKFQEGAWSATLPDIAVFDDAFVAQNVCSGIDIQTEHRQNLHELILGAQGVALNTALQAHIAKIEEHNRELRTRSDAIPASIRAGLPVEGFCALSANPRIADDIKEAERNLSAAKASDAVRQEKEFATVELPSFEIATINSLLVRDLPNLDANAATQVQAHFGTLGDGAEGWVADGVRRIDPASRGHDHDVCPFCAQDLRSSRMIDHYRAYFSEGYANLKSAIRDQISRIQATHAGDVPDAFERAVRIAEQRRQFWKDFTIVPEFSLDTAGVGRAWKVARDAVLAQLQAKAAAPLEQMELSKATLEAIAKFDEFRSVVAGASTSLSAANAQIQIVKERASTANVAALSSDLAKLKAAEARHTEQISPLCQAVLNEKAAKVTTETLRDQARESLDRYRQTVFPAYETSINAYLQKFNAGFRLGSVASVNIRQGSSCTYNVVINDVAVALTPPTPSSPSFRNTLSAGDRNTLALAFFFAALDQDPCLAHKIVVIDDPMTSLDEHRSLTTIQEMRRLINKVDQVIVLSHSKPFLCGLWDSADRIGRSAIKITRDLEGSSLATWHVDQDSVTEHDKRHSMVVGYVASNNTADERAVASALRSILESFVRVAYPEDFPPGSLLGPFLNTCRQRIGRPNQILGPGDVNELQDLLDYGNKFHHDSNPAWETEVINDLQLQHFCTRTLNFARR